MSTCSCRGPNILPEIPDNPGPPECGSVLLDADASYNSYNSPRRARSQSSDANTDRRGDLAHGGLTLTVAATWPMVVLSCSPWRVEVTSRRASCTRISCTSVAMGPTCRPHTTGEQQQRQRGGRAGAAGDLVSQQPFLGLPLF